MNKMMMQNAKYEAGKFVARWHLGLKPVPVELPYRDDEEDGSWVQHSYGRNTPMTDGQYSIWSAAGYAALLHGQSGYAQYLWCKGKLDETLEELANGTHEQDDFDQLIYTGVELAGKADHQAPIIDNILKIMPLSENDKEILKWSTAAYLRAAKTVIDRNWKKVQHVKEILLEKGFVDQAEAKELFKNWGKPQNLDLSFRRIEEAVGSCPCESIDRTSFDLVRYVAFSREGYPYSGKEKFAA